MVFRTQQAAAGGSCVDHGETTRVRFSFNSVSNLGNGGAPWVPRLPCPLSSPPAAGLQSDLPAPHHPSWKPFKKKWLRTHVPEDSAQKRCPK